VCLLTGAAGRPVYVRAEKDRRLQTRVTGYRLPGTGRGGGGARVRVWFECTWGCQGGRAKSEVVGRLVAVRPRE
jgi:hypothetical protein